MGESASLNCFHVETTHVLCLTQCVAYHRQSKNVFPHDYQGTEKGCVTQAQQDGAREFLLGALYLGCVLAGVKERAW